MKKGITLIEVIVVILIITIVVAIISPVIVGAKMSSKVAASKLNLKGFWQGLLLYQQDYDQTVDYGPVSLMGFPSPAYGFRNFLKSYSRDETFTWKRHPELSPCGIKVGAESMEGLIYMGNGISDWPRDIIKYKNNNVILADKNCNTSNVKVDCQFCSKRSIGITIVGNIIDRVNAERHVYDQDFYQSH